MILATTTPPSPEQFLGFWSSLSLTLTVLLSFASLALLVLNRRQKREVSFSFTPASKEEFDAHVRMNREEHIRLEEQIADIDRVTAARVEKISESISERIDARFSEMTRTQRDADQALHNRINDILKAVSRLEGRAAQQQPISRP